MQHSSSRPGAGGDIEIVPTTARLLNPKSEARNPKQIRNPMPKGSKQCAALRVLVLFLFPSFEFVSDFELRISDLGDLRLVVQFKCAVAKGRHNCDCI
jgi:hypothetical protein